MKQTKNDITGDRLVSKAATPEFRNNYDLIFRKKPKSEEEQQAIVELTKLQKELYDKKDS